MDGLSVSLNRLELKDYVESLAVVVHMYKEKLNVDAAFGIFTDQERNRCMIIGRSDADGIDIGSNMRSMGAASGPRVRSAQISQS